jgi:hypothetical protein
MKLQQLLEAPQQQRSLVTFIRKQTGVRGKSEHNGRGAWWLHSNEPYDWEAMVQRLYGNLGVWKKKGILLDAVRYGNERLLLLFSPKYFHPHYRMFATTNPDPESEWQSHMLGSVIFTYPRDMQEIDIREEGGRRVV